MSQAIKYCPYVRSHDQTDLNLEEKPYTFSFKSHIKIHRIHYKINLLFSQIGMPNSNLYQKYMSTIVYNAQELQQLFKLYNINFLDHQIDFNINNIEQVLSFFDQVDSRFEEVGKTEPVIYFLNTFDRFIKADITHIIGYFINLSKSKDLVDISIYSELFNLMIYIRKEIPYVFIPASYKFHFEPIQGAYTESIFNLNNLEISYYNNYNYSKENYIKAVHFNYESQFGVFTIIQSHESKEISTKISFLRKLEGISEGFILNFDNRNPIYVKELFCQSSNYKNFENGFIKEFLASTRFENEIIDEIRMKLYDFISKKDIKKEYNFKIISNLAQKVTKSYRKSTIFEYHGEIKSKVFARTAKILSTYINPYGEIISYINLFIFGFIPPLSFFKSVFLERFFLMIDKFPDIDEEFGTNYQYAESFKLNIKNDASSRTSQINNLMIVLHSLKILNCLFHIGDLHDGNYAICSSNDEMKFKIILFDLWVSPSKTRPKSLLSFNLNDKTDRISEKIYNILYSDENVIRNVTESKSMITKIMNIQKGKYRLPYITIKSLKYVFQQVLTKRLNIIYSGKDIEDQMLNDFNIWSRKTIINSNYEVALISQFLIEKIYEKSNLILIENDKLISACDCSQTHKYFVSTSKSQIFQLYEVILSEIHNYMSYIFIKPKENYFIEGNAKFESTFESFCKNNFIDIHHQFVTEIVRPKLINIFVVLLIMDNSKSIFFSSKKFKEITKFIKSQYYADNYLYVIYQNIICIDLYRLHFIKSIKFTESIIKINKNTLIFVFHNKQEKNKEET